MATVASSLYTLGSRDKAEVAHVEAEPGYTRLLMRLARFDDGQTAWRQLCCVKFRKPHGISQSRIPQFLTSGSRPRRHHPRRRCFTRLHQARPPIHCALLNEAPAHGLQAITTVRPSEPLKGGLPMRQGRGTVTLPHCRQHGSNMRHRSI